MGPRFFSSHLLTLAPVASLVMLTAIAPGAAQANEREVATLTIKNEPALELAVLRQRLGDGGLRLRLSILRKGEKKPKMVILYEGGDDDDSGPGDKALRAVTLDPFDLPAETRGVRVGFEFVAPGSRHRQVDSWLVSVDDARVVLSATTRRESDRSRLCRAIEQTTLTRQSGGRLIVQPSTELEGDLDDDDEPVEKSCQGTHAGRAITYRFDGEIYVQIDPPPGSKPAAALAPASKDEHHEDSGGKDDDD